MSKIKALGVPKIKALGLGDVYANKDTGEVYTIKLSSDLYDGSANEKDVNKLKKGLLYGISCKFDVTNYIGEKPQKASDVNWQISYYDIEEGKQETLLVPATGESVKLDMRNNDTCGSNLYIRAYITTLR